MFLIETLLGALTGYGTNDIAIRQLFSKNGVVVRERAQFTDLLVRVLQEEIFSQEVLDDLRKRPELEEFFTHFVMTLVTEEVPYALSDQSLADFDDGQLKNIIDAHLDEAAFSGLSLNASYVHQRLLKMLEDEALKEAFLQTLRSVAEKTPKELGFGKALDGFCVPFEELSTENWQAWLKKQRANYHQKLDGMMHEANTEKVLPLAEVLPIDGEMLVLAVEKLIFSIYKSQDDALIAFLKDNMVQEAFFGFAERVLPDFVDLHLANLIEALSPVLINSREEIEQMILESISDCGDEKSAIFSAVSNLVKQFMTTKEGEEDWLSSMLHKAVQSSKDAVWCQKVSNMCLAKVVERIDAWRQLDANDEEAVEAVHESYAKLRAFMVRCVDASLHKTMLSEGDFLLIGQKCLDKVFDWAAVHYDGAKLGADLKVLADKPLNQPLGMTFLSDEKCDALYENIREKWANEGEAWLNAQNMDHTRMQTLVHDFVMDICHAPIARLICDSRDVLSLGQIAKWLQGWITNHLSAFLGKMTHEQLDNLSEEEIRQLVLDVLGRDMRPLAYLGGGIGAVVGAATGGAMQLSGMTPDPEQIAAVVAGRSAMYGAVGYGTNVMAVKGLFWPYEKKFGMQGLICKNQERFAHKMQDLAEEYIINDAIWTAQVQKVAGAFSAHYDEALYAGLHHMDKYREGMIRPHLKNLALSQLGRTFSCIDTIAPMLQTLAAKESILLLDGEQILGMAQSSGFMHKGICALATKEAQTEAVSLKIKEKIDTLPKETWTCGVNAMLDAVVPLRGCETENVWQKLQPLYKYLPEYLSKSTGNIVGFLGDSICSRLPFPLQFGYKLAGGDALVAGVVDVFINKKMPGYFFRHESEMKEGLLTFAKEKLVNCSLKELGINVTPQDGLLIGEMAARISQESIYTLMLSVMQSLEAMPEEKEKTLTQAVVCAASPMVLVIENDDVKTALKRATCALDWSLMARQAMPLIHHSTNQFMQELSFDDLLGMAEGGLWQRIDAALVFTEEEKTHLTSYTNTIWNNLEPFVWTYVSSEGRKLLTVLDVPELVYERVSGLSPEALEKLVREMAQPYFTRVERMGWLGAVVAIPAAAFSMMLGGF